MEEKEIQSYPSGNIDDGTEMIFVKKADDTLVWVPVNGAKSIARTGEDGIVVATQLPSGITLGSFGIPYKISANENGQIEFSGLTFIVSYAIVEGAGKVLIRNTDFTQTGANLTLAKGDGIVNGTIITLFPAATYIPQPIVANTDGQSNYMLPIAGTVAFAIIEGVSSILIPGVDLSQASTIISVAKTDGIINGTRITFFTT